MNGPESSPLLAALVEQEVVIDLRSPYVCLGTLRGFDAEFLEVADADLHDFRDSKATREVYVFDSARLGIRRNRAAGLDPPLGRRRHHPRPRHLRVVTPEPRTTAAAPEGPPRSSRAPGRPSLTSGL